MDSETSRSQTAGTLRTSARSVVRSLAAGSLLLKKQLWVWPLIAGVILAAIGWFLRAHIEKQLKDELSAKLETVLKADVKALELWLKSQETTAVAVAGDSHVLELSLRLIEIAARPDLKQLDLLQAPELERLRTELEPVLAAHDYIGWVVVDRHLRIVASKRNEIVGVPIPSEDVPYVRDRALLGHPTVSVPRKSTVLLPASDGKLKVGVPTMFAWAPLRNGKGEVVAGLGMRIRPGQEFTEILGIARSGGTGETYAFNSEGILLSQSRFDDQLKQAGLLREDEDSILNLSLRNPQVDLTRGNRSPLKRTEQPLTRLASEAIAKRPGVDVEGYPDYRGVPVVGAWTWMEAYDMGIGTEQDAAEAFGPLNVLRQAFWGMFAMLGAAALAIFAFTFVVARLNREARIAALKARQLGQYALDQKLGEGGMGVVYRARHAMLQRPTAVKFLNAEATNDQSIARFEREVQLTGRLNHPNTIAIYDYGRTPEGIFYYAMEYLEGINLEDLVRQFGPLPENRVIHILLQVCGSLAEAHRIGLIHRDIKPANIMLTERGGIFDFVKLLDFGLVKAADSERHSKLTSAGSFTGTPLYLSPEAVQNPDEVDARSDLYAVGAVGYWLLTGTTVFDGGTVLDILQKQAFSIPEAPSKRLNRPVSPELEELLLKCLAKKREDRPQSAVAMVAVLEKLRVAPWTGQEAERWWIAKGLRVPPAQPHADTAQGRLSATMIGPQVESPDQNALESTVIPPK